MAEAWRPKSKVRTCVTCVLIRIAPPTYSVLTSSTVNHDHDSLRTTTLASDNCFRDVSGFNLPLASSFDVDSDTLHSRPIVRTWALLDIMRFSVLALVTSLASVAFADVAFVAPAAGSTFTGGSTLQITFKESGTSPAITTLQSYQLFLMAGGNSDSNMVCTMTRDGTEDCG